MAITAAALTTLASGLAGSLVLPDDPAYAAVRQPFIGRLDEILPRAVVRCAAPDDVVRSIAWARDLAVPVALRSGGNSLAGWSCTSGLLIDLAALDTIRLDGDTAIVGPGVRIGTLAQRLAGSQRTVPCGWCPGVAAGGAILGGGYGVLGRLYGLGSDHLRAAQVALVDGRLVWCDARREPDLFWALRGAGGGLGSAPSGAQAHPHLLGAVTSFVLDTRPAVPATVFECRWPYRHAARVIEEWMRWAPAAPDGVNAELALTATDDPAEDPYVTVFGASVGAETRFLETLDPAPETVHSRALSGPELACHHAYPGEAGAGDVVTSGPPPDAAPGLRLARSEFFDAAMPPSAVAPLVAHFARDRVRGEFRDLEFIAWGGAYARIPASATAFVHRGARFMLKHTVQVGHLATGERRQAASRWVAASWNTTHPWGSGLVYPNYPEPGLPPWSRAYHGANLDRLLRIRARYVTGTDRR